MFLDDSACNLASLNLMKFVDRNGRFDIESFRKAVDITITAQEIIVGFASYPTKKIEITSHDFRPLGLGYANLGALLMSQGMSYDSDRGRDYAASITAIMTGEAYLQSARIAGETGPCAGFDINRKPFLEVMRMHRDAVKGINRNNVPDELYDAASNVWSDAVDLGELNGYRNSQATVLAPTGTIGFMMDCDTTGIEPDLALVKYRSSTILSRRRCASWDTTTPPSKPSRNTSTTKAPSKARRDSAPSTFRSSTARSGRSMAHGRSTTWAISR